MFIGLTGAIASGKNFIAQLFENHGCYTLDADVVSRIITAKNETAYWQIVETFGQSILDQQQEINRGKLGEIVSSNFDKLKILESIVHPLIADYSVKWYKKIKSADDKAVCVYHAPLIIESGVAGLFDDIILIYISADNQKERLKKRGHPPYEYAVKLMNNQMSYEEKLKYASYIVNNDLTKENAKKDVDRIMNLINLYSYTNKINRKVLKNLIL